MPYAFGDYILTSGEITCQSFGLDRKKTIFERSFFLAPTAGLAKIKRISIVLSSGVRQSASRARRVYRGEDMRHTTRTGAKRNQRHTFAFRQIKRVLKNSSCARCAKMLLRLGHSIEATKKHHTQGMVLKPCDTHLPFGKLSEF